MRWLTLAEATEATGQTTHTIRTLIRQGRLPAYRFTRRLLFRPDDVQHLIEDARLTAPIVDDPPMPDRVDAAEGSR